MLYLMSYQFLRLCISVYRGMSQLYPKIKASRMKRTLLFVRDAFFITLFKTLFSIYKIHEFFTSRGSVESACKV